MIGRILLGLPTEPIRQWAAAVTGLRWINDEQDEPTAPRLSVAEGVETYGALGLDDHGQNQATAHKELTDEELASEVTWTITGTPAENDRFGVIVNNVLALHTAAAGEDAAAVAAALRAVATTAWAAEPVTVGGSGADITATAVDPEEPVTFGSGYDTQTPPGTAGIDEDPTLSGYALEYSSISHRGTLACEVYGPAAFEAMLRLQHGLGDQLYRDALSAIQVALTMLGTITDEPVLRSATREPTASLVFAVDWVSVTTQPVPLVAETNLETTAVTAAAGGSP